MSVAAVMLVKDEADIIEDTLANLAAHVDEIIVSDNGSTDGTYEKIYDSDIAYLYIEKDEEVGYWQSRKTTAMAMRALERGHSWVIPCDADEIWYVQAEAERPIREYLNGLAPDVQIVQADLYNHIPTGEDKGAVSSPVRRIGWRKVERGALPKVACRLHPSLVIHPGNHGASYAGVQLAAPGLCVRHFSWRTPKQYLRKIRNGAAAYRETNLPKDIGVHWRMFDDADDETILEHFHTWFWSANPKADQSLIYDPAPLLAGK